MLYVFYGNDTPAVRERAHTTLDTLQHTNPLLSVTQISALEYESGKLTELAAATSLFNESQVYILDTPSEHADFKADVLAALAALAASAHTFIVIEGALNAAQKKLVQTHANQHEEYTAKKLPEFNTFSLAEALLQKDKKTLWLRLQQARQAGVAAEASIGVLWWQLKLLRLAARTKTAEEAGQKTFPYDKAKRALSRFGTDEPDQLSRDLLLLYHAGHDGTRDIDEALEAWVLAL